MRKRIAYGDGILSCRLRSLCHGVDLAGKARLLAGGAVLVEHMVRCSLVDRLAGGLQEGLRFISVSCLNGVEHVAGSRTNAGLFRSVLGAALLILLDAADGCFDVRQMFHLP